MTSRYQTALENLDRCAKGDGRYSHEWKQDLEELLENTRKLEIALERACDQLMLYSCALGIDKATTSSEGWKKLLMEGRYDQNRKY